MTVIDKVIKQCFKDTAGGFLMMIFGGLAITLFISFVFTILFVPVLMILMVVGLYKVAIHTFDKSVYGEEAMFYQVLPVSSEQIVVSRIFVGMATLVTFHLASYGSLLGGVMTLGLGDDMAEVFRDILLMEATSEFSYLIGGPKLLLAAMIITYLATVFLEAALAFTLITYTRTSGKTKSSGSDKSGVVIVLLLLVRNLENMAIMVATSYMQSSMNLYVFLTGVIVASIVLGCIMCKSIKKRLENNLQL